MTGSDSDDPSAEGEEWTRLRGSLPSPARVGGEGLLVEQEFGAQFRWYDRQATRTRVAYQLLRIVALTIGAAVTVLAASAAPPALTASLAATVVVLEGAQQVFQLQKNWISYRTTAERMRLHWFLYAARRSPYDDASTRTAVLAQAMQESTASESAGWGATMLTPNAKAPGDRAD